MTDRNFEDLTRPPDFEIRADAFLMHLGSIGYEIDLLFAENRTKMLLRVFQDGMSLIGTEDYPNLRNTRDKLQRNLDIESATQNVVEVTISSGSYEYLEKNIRTIDQLASEFGGNRTDEPEIYQPEEDEGDDIDAVMSYHFF